MSTACSSTSSSCQMPSLSSTPPWRKAPKHLPERKPADNGSAMPRWIGDMRAQVEHTRGLFHHDSGAFEEPREDRRSPLARVGALRAASEPPSTISIENSPVRESRPSLREPCSQVPTPRAKGGVAKSPGRERASAHCQGQQLASVPTTPERAAKAFGSPSLQRPPSPVLQERDVKAFGSPPLQRAPSPASQQLAAKAFGCPSLQRASSPMSQEHAARAFGSPSVQRAPGPLSRSPCRTPQSVGGAALSARSGAASSVAPVCEELPAIGQVGPTEEFSVVPPAGDLFMPDEEDSELIAWSLGLKMDDIEAGDSLMSALKDFL